MGTRAAGCSGGLRLDSACRPLATDSSGAIFAAIARCLCLATAALVELCNRRSLIDTCHGYTFSVWSGAIKLRGIKGFSRPRQAAGAGNKL